MIVILLIKYLFLRNLVIVLFRIKKTHNFIINYYFYCYLNYLETLIQTFHKINLLYLNQIINYYNLE